MAKLRLKSQSFFRAIALCAVLTVGIYPLLSEARMGGGRSFGSRGSRGFTPRYSAPASGAYRQAQPLGAASRPYPGTVAAQNGFSSGGIFRNVAAGMAGGFLGSMLFRSLGHAGDGAPLSGSGFGIFEWLILAGLIFGAFKWYSAWAAKRSERGTALRGEDLSGDAEPRLESANWVTPPQSEAEVAEAIRRFDAGFDLETFKESRMDEFFKFQAAWANRDLTAVRGLVTPTMAQLLEGDLQDLKSKGQINRLENIAVRRIEATENWQEQGTEYVTLKLSANVLDYTVDEQSGALVDGDRHTPVKFEEYWTYCRDSRGAGHPWLLSAIHGD